MPAGATHEDLLRPIYRSGQLISDQPTLPEIQTRCREQLNRLHATVRRLQNPHAYPAGVEHGLYQRKLAMIQQARHA